MCARIERLIERISVLEKSAKTPLNMGSPKQLEPVSTNMSTERLAHVSTPHNKRTNWRFLTFCIEIFPRSTYHAAYPEFPTMTLDSLAMLST